MSNLPYTKHRAKIQTGDIALFRGRSLFSKIISLWTRSVYTHSGIFVWLEFAGSRRLVVMEALEGRGVFPLPMTQVLRRGQVEWFKLTDRRVKRHAVAGFALGQWGKRYASPWQLVRTFTWTFSRLCGKPRDDDPQRFYCSELVAEALHAGGYHNPEINVAAGASPEIISRLPCLQRMGVLVK